MIPHPKNPGLRLRKLRSRSAKSQHAFSDHCQGLGIPITRNMIANWESSRSAVPARMIPLLAYALNVDVTELLPDLRQPAAASFEFKKKPVSRTGNARKKPRNAARVSLKHLILRDVLAPFLKLFSRSRSPLK